MSTNPYTTLNTDAGVRAIVGNADSPQTSKIYPGLAPESAALPYVEYNVITDTPFSTIKGVSDAHSEHIQFSCHALTYTGAQALADAVHDALEGDGYQSFRSGAYQSPTKTHTVVLDWSYIY